MRKTQMVVSSLTLSWLSLRGCVYLCEEVAANPHCTAVITENLSASNSTFTHMPFYRDQSATLCAAALFYNPHSRNCTAAPRFSPTRFILPSLILRPIRS
jgi:hypothetical protein